MLYLVSNYLIASSHKYHHHHHRHHRDTLNTCFINFKIIARSSAKLFITSIHHTDGSQIYVCTCIAPSPSTPPSDRRPKPTRAPDAPARFDSSVQCVSDDLRQSFFVAVHFDVNRVLEQLYIVKEPFQAKRICLFTCEESGFNRFVFCGSKRLGHYYHQTRKKTVSRQHGAQGCFRPGQNSLLLFRKSCPAPPSFRCQAHKAWTNTLASALTCDHHASTSSPATPSAQQTATSSQRPASQATTDPIQGPTSLIQMAYVSFPPPLKTAATVRSFFG